MPPYHNYKEDEDGRDSTFNCEHFLISRVLACNPPYGQRIGDEQELDVLYSALGQFVRQEASGWQLWLLSGNPKLTGALRLKASRRIPVSNGGIDCRWLQYEIR